jgi:peroxiredoxin
LLVKFSPAFPEEKWRGLLERSLRDYAYRRFSEAGRELNEKTAGDGLIGKPPPQTIFLGPDGNFFNISQFRGRKRVVLIFLRGFPGYVCMSCSAQTTTLAEQEEEFKKRDAQVILVYPGHPDTVPTFLEATRNYSAEVDLPYPVLLDIDLAATERFGVKGNLVKPATVIIDKSGIIRYAYVGEKTYDRPAAADTIAELDKIRD